MSGLPNSIRPQTMTGQFKPGGLVDPAKVKQHQKLDPSMFTGFDFDVSALIGDLNIAKPEARLLIFDPQRNSYIGTSLTETDWKAIQTLDPDSQNLDPTQVRKAEKFLANLGFKSHHFNSSAAKVRATQLLASGDVSPEWVRAHRGDINHNHQTAIQVGKALHRDFEHVISQNRTVLQDPHISWHTQNAQSMARLILNKDTGKVDRTMAREFLKQLDNDVMRASFRMKPGPHRIHQKKILKLLLENDGFRSRLESIDEPKTKVARDVVKATMGLKSGLHPHSGYARQAVLSAMLAEVRQQGVGSCFATCVLIHLQENDPVRMMEILTEAVETGSVSTTYKRANRDPVDFVLPLNTTVDRRNYTTKLTMADDNIIRFGKDQVPYVSIHDVPGVKAALLAARIPEGEHVARVNQVLDQIKRAQQPVVIKPSSESKTDSEETDNLNPVSPKKAGPPAEITMETIINSVIDHYEKYPKSSVRQGLRTRMKSAAEAAFHSQMENPLLRATEYTLAGFAANKRTSKELYDLVTGLNQKVFTPSVIDQHSGKVGLLSKLSFRGFANDLKNKVHTAIYERLSLEYDSDLIEVNGGPNPSDDPEKGGFRLTWVTDPDSGATARINDTAALKKAVRQIVLETLQSINVPKDDSLIKIKQSLAEAVVAEVENLDIDTLVGAVKDLQKEPLGLARGADSRTIFSMVYRDVRSKRETFSVDDKRRYKDAKSFLIFMKDQLQKMEATVQNSQSINHQSLDSLSVSIGSHNHAMLLRPTRFQNFTTYWRGGYQGPPTPPKPKPSTFEALKQFVGAGPQEPTSLLNDDPNLKELDKAMNHDVALSSALFQEVGDSEVQKVFQFINRYSNQFDTNQVQTDWNAMDEEDRNAEQLYRLLLRHVQEDPIEPNTKATLDIAMFRTFKPPTNPMPFLDTNWGGGRHHVILGTVDNPYSGQTEFWEFHWDGVQEPQLRRPFAPDDWMLKNTEWTMETEPWRYNRKDPGI